MKPEEAAEYCKSDPNLGGEEKEFSVGFTKKSDMATVHTSISGQMPRLLTHSDVVCTQITVYNENSETYSHITLEEFDGEGHIVNFVGKVPIENLKINNKPRSQRSYAQIISTQNSVNIG